MSSYPSSPHSSTLPSPPSSPGSSFSSLPSSAFSLSVPPSPPLAAHDHTAPGHSLIIPSLSLDTADSSAGTHALGNVRLLIVGARGSGKTLLAESLVHGNADVVEAGEWVDDPRIGRMLCASTGGEIVGNVRLVEAPGFEETDEASAVVAPVVDTIHASFRAVLPLLSPTHPPDTHLRDLLASPHSHLFTAALLLTSSPPTPLESTLLTLLSTHIPVLPLPFPSRTRTHTHRLTPTAQHLRTTLFRRPATLRKLRREAAERFLRWRALERPGTLATLLRGYTDRADEKHEWEWRGEGREPCAAAHDPLDPLHVPSLFLLSLALLRPLRDAVGVHWLAVGAFCAGVGVGWVLGGARAGAGVWVA